MEITVDEAFYLLLDARMIMVSCDEDDDLMECTLDYFLDSVNRLSTGIIYLSDAQIEEILEYLRDKEKIELWD